MTTVDRRKHLGLGAALVAAAVAAWLWGDGGGAAGPGAADAGARPPSAPAAAAPPGVGRGAPAVRPAPPLPVTPIPASVEARPGPATFEGLVVSRSTGQPIPGAEVTFEHRGAAFAARADGQGAFRFVAEREGEWTLGVVTAAGFHPFAPEWGHSPVALSARAGLQVKGLVFTLVPAVDYAGRVVGHDGGAVAGAEVVLLGAGAGESALVAGPARWTTGPGGSFSFTARDGDWLEASHPAHGRGHAEVDFEAQVRGGLTIRLALPFAPARAALSGTVVDGAGRGLPGALVFLAEARRWSFEPADEEVRSARPDVQGPVERAAESDPEGRFRFDGLTGERYIVSARARGLVPASRWARPGQPVTLALHRGGRIAGSARDGQGRPVPAFTVVVREATGALSREPFGAEAFVSPDGSFALEGVPDGTFALVAGAAGYAPSEEVAAVVKGGSEARVALTLTRGGAAEGRVTRREDGGPIAQARVAVEANQGEGTSAVPLVAEARSGPDGRFVLSGLAPGKRSVLFTAAGRHGRILSGIEVREGAVAGPLEVDLAPLDAGQGPQLELVGIGAVLAPVDEVLVIREVIAGGGAAEVGLGLGDRILEVDGKRVSALGFGGSIEAIRGVEGTAVRLAIGGHDGGARTVDVPRRKVVK